MSIKAATPDCLFRPSSSVCFPTFDITSLCSNPRRENLERYCSLSTSKMIIYAHLIAIIDVVHFFNSIACGPVSASEDPASLVHVDVEGPLLASPSALPADNGENLYATVMEIGSKVRLLGARSQRGY